MNDKGKAARQPLNSSTHIFSWWSIKPWPSAALQPPQSSHPRRCKPLWFPFLLPVHPLSSTELANQTLPGSPSEKHSCVPGPVSVTLLLCNYKELGASRSLRLQPIRRRYRSGHGAGAALRNRPSVGKLLLSRASLPTNPFICTDGSGALFCGL